MNFNFKKTGMSLENKHFMSISDSTGLTIYRQPKATLKSTMVLWSGIHFLLQFISVILYDTRLAQLQQLPRGHL